MILASTSEIYGKRNQVPNSGEDDRVIGLPTKSRWNYSTSEAVDVFLGPAYHRQKGVRVVIFRLFNTVHPRQTGRYGMVVPHLVRQALDGKLPTVYGNGSQTRYFLHMKDAVKAVVA